MIVTPVGKKFGKYKPGDEFSFPDRAARIMILAGKLRDVQVPPQAAAAKSAPAKRAPSKRAPREYQRRDMQAES